MSQFLISSAQRSDSGIYKILLKNDYGEKSHDIRIRVAGTIINNPTIETDLKFAFISSILRQMHAVLIYHSYYHLYLH